MRLANQQEATAISEDILEKLDPALMEDDFALYAELLHVPHHIRTKIETFDIRDMDQLRACFVRYREHAEEFEATWCKRVLLDAKFRAKQRIEARYSVSYYDEDGVLVTPTTFTTSILMLINGKWRICGSDSNTKLSTGIGQVVQDAISNNMKTGTSG